MLLHDPSKQKLFAYTNKQVDFISKGNDKGNLSLNDITRKKHPILDLQNTIGNHAVQRLMSQTTTKMKGVSDLFTKPIPSISGNQPDGKISSNSLLLIHILSKKQQNLQVLKDIPDLKNKIQKQSATHSKTELVKINMKERRESEVHQKNKIEFRMDKQKEEVKKIPKIQTQEKKSIVQIDVDKHKETGKESLTVEEKISPQAPVTSKVDLAFQAAKKQINIEAKKQKAHVEPLQKVNETTAVSALPGEDQKAQALEEIHINEMGKVGEKQQDKIKKFDAQEFKKNFRELAKKSKIPKEEKEVKEFSKDPPIYQGASDTISNDISNKQNEMIGPLDQKIRTEPSLLNGVEIKKAKDIPEPLLKPAPKKIDSKQVIPKPKTKQEVTSVQKESTHIEKTMSDNRLSDNQLAESREPSFIETLKVKQETLQKIDEAPNTYRQQESAILQQAETGANESLLSQLGNMNKIQQITGKTIFKSQDKTKREEIEKRQHEIKETIDGIYKGTVFLVKFVLESLTTQVKDDFTKGLQENKEKFTENITKGLEDYYGWGVINFLVGHDEVIVNEDGTTTPVTLMDKLSGKFSEKELEKTIDPVVYDIFKKEKEIYLNNMDIVLDNVANKIQTGLNGAQSIINVGKMSIDNFIQTLKGDERSYAEGLKKDVETKFDNLEENIVDTRDDLLQTLVDDYKENVDQLETTFNEINDDLKKSWIDRAIEFIETTGKTIFQLAELLLSILTRMANLVWDIVKHPIRFFETLVLGLMQGIGRFIDNIGTYMKEAFWTWITGATSARNIQLSSASGIVSLFDLVLQVLNLSAADVRAIVEKIAGKELMQKIERGIEIGEKALEPLAILLYKGPLAFWNYIKDKLEDIIKSSFDRIKESVFNSFIGKGLKWIAGFFVLGGGFVKIVKAIVNAFQFVADNLENIRKFFDSIFDSMEEALQGNTDGVANKIIGGLVTGVVLALDFIAKQIGIDNIVKSVQKIIHSIRNPIVSAIEWIVKQVVKLVKGIGRLIGIGKTDKKDLEVVKENKEIDKEDDDNNSLKVKIQAESRLKELVGAEGTIEEAENSIKIIYKELHPKGLQKIWIAQKSENDFAVLVKASDPEEIAEFTPLEQVEHLVAKNQPVGSKRKKKSEDEGKQTKAEENRTVKIRTTLTFNKDIPIEQLPGQRALTKDKLKLSPREQKDILTRGIDLPKKSGKIKAAGPDIGGKVIIDPDNPKTVDILTWNTSQNKKSENYSHAESIFIRWAESLQDLADYVTRIDIYANEGPCELCIQEFPQRLLEIFRNAKMEEKFEKPHLDGKELIKIRKEIEENPNNANLKHLYGRNSVYLILHENPDDRKLVEVLHTVQRDLSSKDKGRFKYISLKTLKGQH